MSVFAAGHILTSADLDTLFPTGVGAWTAYTPAVVQSTTPTLTVEFAQYMKIGRLVVVQLSVSITGAGTAANTVTCTFPAAAGTPLSFRRMGGAALFDASVSTWYEGMALWASNTTFKIQAHNTTSASPLGVGGGFSAALAAGDLVCAELAYVTTT